MPRIPEINRLAMVDAHIAHYGEANTINGSDILLEPLYGLPELQAQRTEYSNLSNDILRFDQTTIPNIRSSRDGIFGTDSEDVNGVWIRLMQYKKRVSARLGARHPLTRTVPNIGEVTIERYLTILRSFANHWLLVNASLASPLVLGPFAIATMQAAIAAIETKLTELETAIDLFNLKNEQQAQLFGDEDENEREQTSIVARLLLYHSEIESRFPGQPIAATLPPIFPDEGGTTLPTFAMNYIAQPNGVLKVFYNPPVPALATAAILYLKEGALILSQPVTSTTPGTTPVHIFNGITLVGELDRLELRNAAGVTIARGVREPSLAEPD